MIDESNVQHDVVMLCDAKLSWATPLRVGLR